ncbi:hypothetical protein [Streptomyces sp. NPDC088258]|uniref:hypothetical protein n=1 Tax=Streptomyces sp. NPDC088258 TaxID=3365849 RepID=UPI00380C6679
MIIAADFPKQVTHSVVWLSEMSLDIDLIQVGLCKVDGHLVAGFTKVYPTPEVEEFTLAPARVEGEAAARKLQERSRSRNAVHVLIGAGLLPEGTRLRLTPRHGAPESIRNAIHAWVEEDISRATVTWTNSTAKPLIWDADGVSYSPTGLAKPLRHHARPIGTTPLTRANAIGARTINNRPSFGTKRSWVQFPPPTA